jgi:hypothetical protein
VAAGQEKILDDFDDRDRRRRSEEPREPRRPSRSEHPPRDPIRRRPDYGDEAGYESRPGTDRPRRAPEGEEPEVRRRRPVPEDEPVERRERYADRFRRQPVYRDVEPDDRSLRSTRDPYDRLRRVGNRAPRRVEVDFEGETEYSEYEDDLEVAPRPRRTARRPSREQAPRFDQQRIRDVGSLIANPAPEVRPLVLGGLAALGSLVLLTILILVRSGSAGDWVPLHLDAEGTPTSYGSQGALWRLPFFALFTTLMTFGLGWWLRARESYAVQFLIVGALIVHSLIRVGAINLLW